MKQKTKKINDTKEKWSNNDSKSILTNNIIFEIHIWHFFCHIKLFFNKIEEGFMSVY
jgi:hypothetical protein